MFTCSECKKQTQSLVSSPWFCRFKTYFFVTHPSQRISGSSCYCQCDIILYILIDANNFRKALHLNVWQGFEYASEIRCSSLISSIILRVLIKMNWICPSKFIIGVKCNFTEVLLDLNLLNTRVHRHHMQHVNILNFVSYWLYQYLIHQLWVLEIELVLTS